MTHQRVRGGIKWILGGRWIMNGRLRLTEAILTELKGYAAWAIDPQSEGSRVVQLVG